MKKLIFTLPESLDKELRYIKNKTGYTISDLIRQGLVLIIEKYAK